MASKYIDHYGRINFRFKPSEKIEDEVYSSRLNALIEAINMNALVSFSGGTYKKEPMGLTQSVKIPPSSELETHPLQVVKTDSLKVKVRYGTAGGEVPTIGGSDLTTDLADSPELTLTNTDTVVYLAIDYDTSDVDSVTIDSAATLPTDTFDGEDGLFHLQIAGVTISNDVINSIASNVNGSQALQICGSNVLNGLQ